MAANSDLVDDLRRELRVLEDDLRERLTGGDGQAPLADVAGELRAEHEEALASGRSAEGFPAWLDDQVTQAAVAWMLGCVFLRFCEDNRLIDGVWLAGPGELRREAADRREGYFLRNPRLNDRDWLLDGFAHLEKLPATRPLFDSDHNPLWRLTPSADAAERLVSFWGQTDADGELLRDFADPEWGTRFLGDLYQDLSEDARERYALLQTPEFVEEFILDRTLEPALRERDFKEIKLIDPTCGSGHFLLGAFHRLLGRWQDEAPGMDPRSRVQAALDSIHGVDLNPFAVAIAEFRLTVAAMKASGDESLEHAPAYKYHLAAGDSLLHGKAQQELDLGVALDPDTKLSGFTYHAEDIAELQEILQPYTYDVVVGNPPYITVKDKALNTAYRSRSKTCKGKYALTVPLCERFFQLAKWGGSKAGWVGQITSNSFMKREFGSKLIEEFLARRDLAEVIDTSGAYIPGHGTPTVILVGRNRAPASSSIRAVLGIRGEPGTPDIPSKGYVWTSIVEHIDEPGAETQYVSVTDLARDSLSKHPWSLSGGGAVELTQAVEMQATRQLSHRISGQIGFASFTGLDDAFIMPSNKARRLLLGDKLARPLVIGEVVRDWYPKCEEVALTPYDTDQELISLEPDSPWGRHLWRVRSSAENVVGFGQRTRREAGEYWWAWYRWLPTRYRVPLSIAYAEVATHNHFVLDRGGKVFKQTAPVIKLPVDASEDDHLRLLGLLNSSTACFWLKQACHNKGSTVDQHGARQTTVAWENFYQFNGTKLEKFPLPDGAPVELARRLDALAQELQAVTPEAVCADGVPTRERLDVARERWDAIRAEMIALQEELDWDVYRLYRLLDGDLTYDGDLPEAALGERAFEVVLARKMQAGEEETEWFARHRSTPVTEIPARWPQPYRDLIQRRIDLMEERRDIGLLERPEHKRRWQHTPWEDQEREALRGWLLDRMERRDLWFDRQDNPRVLSATDLADELTRDQEFRDVLALATGRPDFHLARELAKLAEPEAVPFLAALRYKDSGMRKRREWEHVWELQRQEDRGELDGQTIPVPPKYAKGDFRTDAAWRHRGKLDVPKERFVAYPTAGRDGEPTSQVFGWAGWDHWQQARALATLVLTRMDADGWHGEQVTPLLAGLAELLPWLRQWHGDHDPRYGTSPAEFIDNFLEQRCAALGLTSRDLSEWRQAKGGKKTKPPTTPPTTPRGNQGAHGPAGERTEEPA